MGGGRVGADRGLVTGSTCSTFAAGPTAGTGAVDGDLAPGTADAEPGHSHVDGARVAESVAGLTHVGRGGRGSHGHDVRDQGHEPRSARGGGTPQLEAPWAWRLASRGRDIGAGLGAASGALLVSHLPRRPGVSIAPNLRARCGTLAA